MGELHLLLLHHFMIFDIPEYYIAELNQAAEVSTFSQNSTVAHKTPCFDSYHNVLKCYIHEKEDDITLELLHSEKFDHYSKETYLLSSLKWPKELKENFGHNQWKHQLILYIPDNIHHQTALLYANGGSNYNKEGEAVFTESKQKPNFPHIALKNHAVVVDLENVPNQFLSFEGDTHPRKEDDILAFTYKNFLQDPQKNAYMLGHLPMAKSVIKAMDAVEQLCNAREIKIKDFVLSGASKRGWAIWLASLEDTRVSAIIPFVIDVLNVQKNLKHICSYYDNNCPSTLNDYVNSGFFKMLGSVKMNQLMEVEDPLQYMRDEKYKARMHIPKYIINASGDDFFVPDSSRLFFSQLPGEENYIRFIPNSPHYISNVVIEENLEQFFTSFLTKSSLPKISWKLNPTHIEVISSEKPYTAKLYVAENPEMKDFRFNSYPENKGNVRYQVSDLKYNCDVRTSCKIKADLPLLNKGWQASFIELYYENNNEMNILTTEINVISK